MSFRDALIRELILALFVLVIVPIVVKKREKKMSKSKHRESVSKQSQIFLHNNTHIPRLYLEVPFEDNELVKKLGAKWDFNCKKWYCTEREEYYKFRNWLNFDFIVLGDLFILVRHRRCYKCHAITPVVAFAMKDYYFDPNIRLPFFQRENKKILLMSSFKNIPISLADYMLHEYRYCTPYGKDEPPSNHCVKCGCKQGNYYLYDELYEPLQEGQFCCDELDDDAEFIKISLDSDYKIICDAEGVSEIPYESNVGRVSTVLHFPG